MIKPNTPQDVLRNAIEYIERLGWTRGDFQKGADGPVCALGATMLGVVNEGATDFEVARNAVWGNAYNFDAGYKEGGNQELVDLYERAAGALDIAAMEKSRELKKAAYGVVGFNDEISRDRRGVISVMKRAIELLDRETIR